MTAIDPQAARVLHDVFGFSRFRPGQEQIIGHLLDREHVLAVMPTGAGKSLCYQVPAIVGEGITVVVSPLVALMDDQVAALRANGVAAVGIHSGMSRQDQVAAWRDLRAGRSRIVYMAPERLMTPRMLDALSAMPVSMFVVDEAHCISKWGVSFRPDYEMLAGLKDRFPRATLAAFTATADRATREDIAGKLFGGAGTMIVHGFDRANLMLAVQAKQDWRRQLLDFLADRGDQSGIVYCLSRKLSEQVAGFLNDNGFNAVAYHAGQDATERKANQDRFMTEPAVVMAATIAFGMGIDKPDIRFVCHVNLPSSLEAYYQEIGRAGRDGAPADTMMLYGLDDIRLRRSFIDEDGAEDDHKLREHKRLDSLLAYCEAGQCRRMALLAYFDEASKPCGNCDNCLDPPELMEGSDLARTVLAAVRDTGETFGAAHVIDVVRGADGRKVTDRGHHRLPSHGAGSDRTRAFWQNFVRQLVAAGHLGINIARYGCLELTDSGRQVLEGTRDFRYRVISETTKTRRRTGAGSPAQAAAGQTVDQDVLARLKALRLDLARQRNVPAYVVFADRTLIEMAAAMPHSLEQMAEINGVGPKKLDDYGAVFLDAIRGEPA